MKAKQQLARYRYCTDTILWRIYRPSDRVARMTRSLSQGPGALAASLAGSQATVFEGQLRSTIQCSECGKESRTFDPFTVLSVPIPPSPASTEVFVQVPTP